MDENIRDYTINYFKQKKSKFKKCRRHPENKVIEDYCFYLTDYVGVDHYECKKCKDELDRALDRENRIRIHNKKQEYESHQRYLVKYNKRREKINKSQKEDIWDFEIKNELCKGLKLKGRKKYLYKEMIPKEVLRFKRATMKLERLINNKKKEKLDLLEKQKELIARLKKPIVECRKHGALFIQDVIKGGKSRWTGEQRYKCRKCMSEVHKDYYERKKDYVLLKHAEYRKLNPEKIKETRLKYKEKIHGKNRNNEAIEGQSSTSI